MNEEVKVCPICGRQILGEDWVYDFITKMLVHETCAKFLEYERSKSDE